MIKLTINHKNEVLEFNIPNNWDDITVEKFQVLANSNKDGLSELEAIVQSISLLTDIPEDLLYKFSLDNFKLISSNFEFLNKEIKDDFKDKITINDETYYVKKDFKDLSLGESVSFDIILSKSEGNLMRCMDMLLTIFLRRKINGELEEYDTKFSNRAELFKDIKIVDVYNLFGFFFLTKRQ